MPDSRYLQIILRFADPKRFSDQFLSVKQAFDRNSGDWLKVDTGTWIVWTDKSVLDWYNILIPFMTQADYIIIYRVDFSERYGWAQQWIWEWIDRKR